MLTQALSTRLGTALEPPGVNGHARPLLEAPFPSLCDLGSLLLSHLEYDSAWLAGCAGSHRTWGHVAAACQ